jgi:hypothetical protein
MESPPVARAADAEPATETLLLNAYRALHEGRAAQCVAELKGRTAAGGRLAAAMLAAARGVQALVRGDDAGAESCFSDAYRHRAPCAAVLRACAGFFREHGDAERAYEAHCLLAQFEQDAFAAYWPRLTPAQQYRYAPWSPDPQGALRAIAKGVSPAGAALLAAALGKDAGDAVSGGGPLAAACQAIAEGRPQAALQAVDEAAAQCVVAHSIRLVAEALAAQQESDAPAAARLMDEAYDLGNPLPVLLRAIAEHYAKEQRHAFRAFECFSLIERMAPGTTLAFWQGLPGDARLRCAPYLFRVNLLARRPHMYGLRRHKRMVVDRFGVAGLAILLNELLHGGPPRSVARWPVLGLQDHALAHAEAYELLGAPRQVSLHLPRIIGADAQAPIEGTSRSFFRCVLKDAVVSGKSNLILVPEGLLFDRQGTEFEQVPAYLEFNFPVLDERDGVAAVLPQEPPLAVLPEALKLTGAQTSNFGHWTMEHMFQLWACLKQPGFDGVPIVIDAQMPAQHREAIEFFAPGHPIVALGMGEQRQVARLWACSKVVYWPGGEHPVAPEIARRLIELADPDLLAGMLLDLQPQLESAGDDSAPPARLYLTRGAGQSRSLEGRTEVERFFEGRGFTVVNPGQLGFVEQLRHLRRASTVILEAGSSVFSLLYCRPGARIGYFPTYDPPELECLNEIFLRLGHKMLALAPGPGESAGEQRPDIGRLALLADELERL